MVRNAFTLVELLIVMAILAVVLAVVAISLNQPYQAAQLQNAIERLALIDRLVRTGAARSQVRRELIVDLDAESIEVVGADGAGAQQGYVLPRGIDMDRLRTASGRNDNGRVAIPVSPQGGARSYAVRLRNQAGGAQWVLFTGVTGQTLNTESENEIVQTLDLLSAARPDAD